LADAEMVEQASGMARTPPPEPPDLPPEEETVVRDDRWGGRPPPAPVTERRVVREDVAEPYEPVPPPDRTLWPWLLLLLALVLGGLAALWYFAREDDPETKPVPAVVRLTEPDAVARLEDEGFETAVRRMPNDAPEGVVFAQDPRGGAELEEGETVTIDVSSGPAAVDVPNVVGLPFEQARERLEEAGLQARRFGVFSEEPEGVVVAQNPAAGDRAPEDTPVRVNVSRGTGRVEVPDVVGRTAADAGSILRRAGLQPRTFQVPSDEPRGEVVAQSPAAGSEIARGDSVRINVSNGQGAQEPAEAEVPDVVSLAEAEAIRRLENAGFIVLIRREETTDPAEDGIVLSQDPEAGETARRGDEVAITVGELTS
jgi:eukaryotic-like serine/threonine-protein kinase